MTAATSLPQVMLSEWGTHTPRPDLVLTAEDRDLAVALSCDRRLVVEELRAGLRIRARSWVGVVRFSCCEVRVVPKLVGGDLGLVQLIDFASGMDALHRHPSLHGFDAKGSSLLDVVALLLAEASERIVRNGLLGDYRETDNDLPVIRGRLRVREQVLKRFGRIDRLDCRYDEHSTDVADNQFLLAALTACRSRVRHPLVAMRIHRLLAVFVEACSLDGVDIPAVRNDLTYNRQNDRYREAHVLAGLVIDALGIDNIYGGTTRCFAFLLDMNRLFEAFITRWLGRLLLNSEYRILPQRRDSTILRNADTGKSYTRIIPDIVVERRSQPGVVLPVDAKYKLYDDKNLSPADIYQTFLYAFAYGLRHADLPSALVIYPSSSNYSGGIRLHVCQSGGTPRGELQVVSVHLPSAVSDARSGNLGPASEALVKLIKTILPPPCYTPLSQTFETDDTSPGHRSC